MYLVDTNIWLELLLGQKNAEEARNFFCTVEASSMVITEFSLYSIGIILTRLEKDEVFEDFISDALEDSGVVKVHLEVDGLKHLTKLRKRYHMDFDDAYQVAVAEKHDLEIVSFDKDFDRTERGRLKPSEINAH